MIAEQSVSWLDISYKWSDVRLKSQALYLYYTLLFLTTETLG